MSSEVLRTALEYRSRNLIPVPLAARKKTPVVKWAGLTPEVASEAWIRDAFSDATLNIGILTGAASDNLLVLDFDDLSTYDDVRLTYPEFSALAERTFSVATNRGVHLYFRTPFPVSSAKSNQRAIDVLGDKRYAVAPPSVHPCGHRHEAVDASREIVTIPSLADIPFLELAYSQHAVLPEASHGLGGRADAILRGDFTGYPSRSEAEAAAVLTSIKSGNDFEGTLAIFEKYAAEGTKFRDKGKNRTDWLRLTYENTLEYYMRNMHPIDRKIGDALSAIHEFPFRPRTIHYDRAVTEAVLAAMRKSGKDTRLHLSCRTIAETAGISHNTAARSLKRLPFLELTRKSNGIDACEFTFSFDLFFSLIHSNTFSGGDEVYQNEKSRSHRETDVDQKSDSVSHDAFRYLALNKVGRRLITVMRSYRGEFKSMQEWATLTDIPYSTVRRRLRQMAQFNFVEAQFETRPHLFALTKTPTEDDLTGIAAVWGTNGAGARQQRRHKQERDRRPWVKREYR